MKRRALISALFAAALAPLATPAIADILPLSAISAYFNSFSTAQAQFTQINPDGTLATGRLMIQRPGRVRFEYDPPDRSLVLATSGSVNIFDARSNSGPNVYPLNRTPLNLILAPRVDLERARMVVAHFAEGPATSVVAQDPDFPEYGTIRLVFTADPVELRQWVVSDDMGRETTVILNDFETGLRLDIALFNLDRELRQRGLLLDR
jgi:outer membrane lipoprotein-sorting protein